MVSVAVIGANGQVGAELCLLLAARPDLTLVPICRTRSGSAFLRWKGIACRHGRIADPADAPRLLADCDLVINSSLATGTPAEIRAIEDRIVQNACAHSKPGATIIHFSTQSVYGDPRSARTVRWRNPYGRAKLATERSLRRAARQFAKPVYILRLGHVCGALQEISIDIRAQIKSGRALIPHPDRSSNTVYTAAIVGAVLQILEERVQSGTYDLMNTPRWSWGDVYHYELLQCGIAGHSPERCRMVEPSRARILRSSIAGAVGFFASVRWLRDAFAKLFAHLPDTLNARGQAWWYSRRARAEIGKLSICRSMPEHLTWIENGMSFFPASLPTRELLSKITFEAAQGRVSWPKDLPDAEPVRPES